jgi:two-component system osmolarity sensor histidine kinase EnvZ
LLNAQGAQRGAFLADLARDERIRVLPAEPDDEIEPFGDGRHAVLLEAKLREQLGPFTRLAGRVNGSDGLWIGFEIEGDPYWILLDVQRLRRQAGRTWLGWLGIAVGLALAGALVISRVINRPLAKLADSIDRVSRGESPLALPQAGPTELAAINRRFNRMASDLNAMDRDRAEALAGISHDIRTPLARLRLEIEMAPIDEAARASMADEIERIDAIVRQFVEFARPDEALTALPVDIPAVLESVLQGFRQQPDAASIRFEPTLEAGVSWRGSATTLARILTNLIENARRYGRSADGSVQVRIGIERTPRGIRLSVRDQGQGVASDQLNRLTRPFTRTDTERNRHGGSGLGLAIVERLARRNGGEATLSLPPGGGLQVDVSLNDAPVTA